MVRKLAEKRENQAKNHPFSGLMKGFWLGMLVCLFAAPSASAATKIMPPLISGIPFLGVLLSIAFGPLLIPAIWHKIENWVLVTWVVLSTWICSASMGPYAMGHMVAAVLIKEYIPFIILISTLYIISNGIKIEIHREGSTAVNVALFLFGGLLANLIGTTGTAILLLRPMLHANRNRKHTVHTVIFFIFLVANIGGCLLPFGDPPLFLGYLKGVHFLWTAKHIFPMFVLVEALLLACYVALDRYYFAHHADEWLPTRPEPSGKPVGPWMTMTGKLNIALMLVTIVLISISGSLPKKAAFTVFGASVHYKSLARELGLLLISTISLRQQMRLREATKLSKVISWGPISEVSRLFVAIFITMAPISLMLRGGAEFFQPLRTFLSSSAHEPFWYFWFVSPFSAFLDNAPTYLVFFKMAGGDPIHLMTQGRDILVAISAGSVFMGAMTYIGNAPNFMVQSIAKQCGVKVPSFFGYMKWSGAILLPVMILVSLIMLY